MNKAEEKLFKRDRAKTELEIILLHKLTYFKSKEEPTIKLNKNDKLNVLGELIKTLTRLKRK